MKKVITLSVIMYVLSANFNASLAYDAPSFPQCFNYTGIVKVEYKTGWHAIVGDPVLKEGGDVVYSLDEGNILQCFCPDNGKGIQSNWWKFSSLVHDQIESYKKQGWNYVPSGRDWGLDSDPYLVKNISYDCKPTSSNTSDNASSNTDTGVGGGEIISTFAATGDNWILFVGLIFGLSLVLAASSLRKK